MTNVVDNNDKNYNCFIILKSITVLFCFFLFTIYNNYHHLNHLDYHPLGAVGVGKQRLSRQGIMHRTVSDLLVHKE